MGDFNENLGYSFITYLNDDNLEAICETWGKLRAIEYARQLGLKDAEYEEFASSNHEQMAPQSAEDEIKLMMFVMALADGREATDLGAVIMQTVEGEVTHGMPFSDAHIALTKLWNRAFFGRVEASALASFLERREDAEMLIFWNAPLRNWTMADGGSYRFGPREITSSNLFLLSCLMIQDEIIEAIGGLYTPNMSVTIPGTLPDGGATAYTPLECAIWMTVATPPNPDAVKEADRKRRRRRIIDLLIEDGASPEKIQLPRAAYLPSEGDPMDAAQQSGNDEAIAVILSARSKATEAEIYGVAEIGSRMDDGRGSTL